MGIDWSSQSVSNCQLEDRVDMSLGSTDRHPCWTLYKAVSSDCDYSLSVFVYELLNSQNSDKHTACREDTLLKAHNSMKHLKRLRHPCIVRFHDVSISSDQMWIMTERVSPLQLVLDTLTPVEICSGLYNIIEALTFLQTRAGLCHNNICPESIFVNESGVWKLGAFDFAYLLSDVNKHSASSAVTSHADKFISADHQVGIDCDADGFLQLASFVLEYATTLGDKVKQFEKRLDDWLNDIQSSNNVPAFAELLDDDIFRNDFIEITSFIRHITVKTEQEKHEFFSHLVPKLYNLPVHLVGSRLSKMLLSRFVILEPAASEFLMPHLLTPYLGTVRSDDLTDGAINPIFPRSLFQRYMLPELFRIFHVRNVHVRCVLLRHFHCYAALFDQETLTSTILPQLLLGVRDMDDELVMLSLSGLATLVPILGGDTVIGCDRQQIFSSCQLKGAATTSYSPVHKPNGSLPSSPLPRPSYSHSRHTVSEKDLNKLEMTRKEKERKNNGIILDSNGTERASDSVETTVDSGPDDNPDDDDDDDDDERHAEHRSGSPSTEHRMINDPDIDAHSNEWTPSAQFDDEWKSPEGRDKHHSYAGRYHTSPKVSSPPRHSAPVLGVAKQGSSALKLKLVDKSKTSDGNVSHATSVSGADDFEDWKDSDWNMTANTISPVRATQSPSTPVANNVSNVHGVVQSHSFPTTTAKYQYSRKGKFSPDQPLGAECDIKQIQIRVTSPVKTDQEEFDFFADMTPRIETKLTDDSLMSLLTQSKQKEQTSRFDVAATSSVTGQELGGDGWDVDFDWSSESPKS